MRMKLRSRRIGDKNYFISIIIIFLFVVIIIYITLNSKSFKDYLLSSIINYTTNKESTLLLSIKEEITSPKRIIYSSFNKSSLSNKFEFVDIDSIDNFDYENANSEFIEDEEVVVKDNPIVYLYNTHQLEEYETDNESHTIKPNVMIASYMLREKLNNLGINTIVESSNVKEELINRNMGYNMSYHISEENAWKAKNTYPSIKYMFDIHRDSVSYDKSYIDINGIRYAKLLFLVGFEHTKEENNEGFASSLNEIVNSVCEGVSKGVIYKNVSNENGSYNNTIDAISTLIEIGSSYSNIEEVNNTLDCLSNAIDLYIKRDL